MEEGDLLYLNVEYKGFCIENKDDRKYLPCIAIITNNAGEGLYNFKLCTFDGQVIKSCGYANFGAKGIHCWSKGSAKNVIKMNNMKRKQDESLEIIKALRNDRNTLWERADNLVNTLSHVQRNLKETLLLIEDTLKEDSKYNSKLFKYESKDKD